MDFTKKYLKYKTKYKTKYIKLKNQLGGVLLQPLNKYLIQTKFGNYFNIPFIPEFNQVIKINENLEFIKRQYLFVSALHIGGNIMSKGLAHIFKYGIFIWYKNNYNIFDEFVKNLDAYNINPTIHIFKNTFHKIYNLTNEKNEVIKLLYYISNTDLTHLIEGYTTQQKTREIIIEMEKLGDEKKIISLKQFLIINSVYDKYIRLINDNLLDILDTTKSCFNISLYNIGIVFNRLKKILEKMSFFCNRETKVVTEREKLINGPARKNYISYLQTPENKIKNTQTLYKIDKLLDIIQSLIYHHNKYLLDFDYIFKLYKQFAELLKISTINKNQRMLNTINDYLKIK